MRWIADIKAAYHTSYCPKEAKVRYTISIMRDTTTDLWKLVGSTRSLAEVAVMT